MGYISFCDSRFSYFTHYQSDVKMEGVGIPSPSIMYLMIFSVKNTYRFCPKKLFLGFLGITGLTLLLPSLSIYFLTREWATKRRLHHPFSRPMRNNRIPAFTKLWLGWRQGLLFIAVCKIGFWWVWTGLDGCRLGLVRIWRLPRPIACHTVKDNFKGQEKSLVLFAVLYAVFSKFKWFFF